MPFSLVMDAGFNLKMTCPLLKSATVRDFNECSLFGSFYGGNTLNHNITSGLCDVLSCDFTSLGSHVMTAATDTNIYMTKNGKVKKCADRFSLVSGISVTVMSKTHCPVG